MKRSYLLSLLLSISPQALLALVVGSDVLVSIEPLINFPAIDIDNTMKGFGWFKNGFSLEDALTNCSFDSVFPISGTVNMRGGQLVLLADLYFHNQLNLQGFGSISGNNHALQFPSGISILPADADIIENVTIILSNDLLVTSTLSFKGTCTLKGGGHTLLLGQSGAITIDDNASLTLESIDVKNIGNGNIACATDNAQLILDDANLFFEDDLHFEKGSLLIRDYVNFFGSHAFIYESAQTSTVQEFATWHIHDDMDFSIGRKNEINDPNPLWFESKYAVIRFSNCHLHITQHGFHLLRGTIVYDDEVTIDTNSTSTENGLIIGDGDPVNDPIIEFDAGAAVRLDVSHVTFNSGSPHIIKTGAHKSARISRNIGSNVFVQENIALPSMSLEILSEMIPPMILASGRMIDYKDTLVVLPGAEFDITSGRRSLLSFLLNGNDSIFFTKGTLPLNVEVESSGNKVMGNGNIAGVITLKDNNAELISEIDGEFDNTIILNDGMLRLDDDLRMGVDAAFTGSGTIDLKQYILHLPPNDIVWTSTVSFEAAQATINLHAKVSLTSTWTINGTMTLNGNGNVLDLKEAGHIDIANNATLKLKNVRLEGVSAKNIQGLSDTSKLILDNVLWIQDGDFTFDAGSLKVLHDVTVAGEHEFIYDSLQTSTIISHSALTFTDKARLHIGRKQINGNEPLYFEDSSAQLVFDNADCHVSANGIQMTRGTVMFDHEVTVDADSTTTANGLIIGSNIQGEDLTFVLDANATVNLKQGHIAYNNFEQDKIVASGNKSARFVRHEGNEFYANTNMTLSNFGIQTASPLVTPLVIDTGKTVTTNNVLVILPDAQFIVDNTSRTSITQQLTGNGSIIVDRASSIPIPISVSGVNNRIGGAGSITAPITFNDSSAILNFALQGELGSTIFLNGGTLNLDANLDLGPNASLIGDGTIDLSSKTASLSGSDIQWSSDTLFVGDSGIIDFNARVDLLSTVTIRGTVIINGNGNTLNFDQSGEILVEDAATLTFKDLRLENVSESSITCLGDASKIVFDDALIILGGDVTVDRGSFEIMNTVDVIGSHTFIYESMQTSTIMNQSELHIANHVQLKIGMTDPNVPEPFVFIDETSVLRLDNCSMLITSSGLQFSKGTIVCERDVSVEIDSTSTANGLVLGNGLVNDTMVFELNPGSTVRFTKGHATYNVANPNAIRSRSKTARLIRSNDSCFHFNFDVVFDSVTIDLGLQTESTLAAGKTISYNDTAVIIPGVEFEITGMRFDDVTNLLSGSNELFINRGTLPLYTIVAGSNNTILGNGSITGQIIFQDAQSQLDWSLNGILANDIAINNGTLKLQKDMELARGVIATTGGGINLQGHRFSLGSKPIAWPTEIYFDGMNGQVELNADLDLSAKWTFSGESTLKGNNKILSLDENGELIVERGSTLTLKDICIHNIQDNNIRCLDNASLLILDNVQWLQDNLVTFSNGALQFKNQVTMCGTGTFAYQTSCTSTIMQQTQLRLDQGFTFSYDPIVQASKELLTFVDNTSVLSLRNASLHTNLTGMQLTKGSMEIKGNCNLTADKQADPENVINEGITIGNQNQLHDFKVTIGIGAICHLIQGSLHYKNVKTNSWNMANEISTFKLMPETTLKIFEQLDLGVGRLEITPLALLEVMNGKQLIGSIFEIDT